MQQAEFCMFCYYRKMRIAACSHAKVPDARQDSAGKATPTVPAAMPARPAVQDPRPAPNR